MGAIDRQKIVELAKGNPADLRQVEQLQVQLKQLEAVGIIKRSGYSLDRPLGRLTSSSGRQTLANAEQGRGSSESVSAAATGSDL